MIWFILGIVYGAGFLYTLRWFIGWYSQGRIDEWEEFMFALFCGVGTALAWPGVWTYRWGYRGWVRFGPEEKDPLVHLSRLCPKPPALETKQERTARLLREKEEEEYRLTRAL